MELDLVEYAKGIAQQANELSTIMAERASKLAESAPSAAHNNAMYEILSTIKHVYAQIEQCNYGSAKDIITGLLLKLRQ